MKENNRIIGDYSSGHPGPLLFVTAGVHGNEPSGVKALKKVFSELEKTKPTIEGRIVGVMGNKSALEKGQRYIDEDLNRTWTEENVKNQDPETQEQREMHEIIEVLEKFSEDDYSKRYFLDCHTTSSDSLPYISVQDVNDNDQWAQRFPTYIVRGFSDIIYGAIDHYMSRTGLTGFVFEAGQHDNPASVENHEGVIWLCLKEANALDVTKLSCYPECVERFTEKNAPSQKVFEITYRHEIKKGDRFKMEPGFKNFQKIKKGQLLATSNGSEITSDWDAYIFMPLYQSQGNDGFFVIEEAE
ncbi:succinylglutamate desuccinylase/aspartoacylase domain-containing protein [Salinimicrobium oceani]|uniref:Succinylglutamate desuccinylase n=1 Tax=Salinimicrobium oceani TaxID=2722702 RepID=A0ABX1CYE0_9FLAO|nr:succinylglutamate desuccinylase/aspartoacylase family protein [Salinimicrobium oceani]NJW53286.1 succinylglutamate desuccinylase [Salinimicrobium oceani]